MSEYERMLKKLNDCYNQLDYAVEETQIDMAIYAIKECEKEIELYLSGE